MARAPRKAPATSRREPKKKPPPKTPLAEWLAAAIGLILVVLTVSLIASEILTTNDSPPDLVVIPLGVHRSGDGFLLKVRVENRGGSPAAGVVVEGELVGLGNVETAEATFDFVPDHSSRQGGLFFQSDPRGGQMSVGAKGYTEP